MLWICLTKWSSCYMVNDQTNSGHRCRIMAVWQWPKVYNEYYSLSRNWMARKKVLMKWNALIYSVLKTNRQFKHEYEYERTKYYRIEKKTICLTLSPGWFIGPIFIGKLKLDVPNSLQKKSETINWEEKKSHNPMK